MPTDQSSSRGELQEIVRCGICAMQVEVENRTAHFRREHMSQPPTEKHKGNDNGDGCSEQCRHGQATSDANNDGCKLCGVAVSGETLQKEHVWKEHMGRPQIECSLCGWELTVNSFSARVKHMTDKHAGESPAFIDYRFDFDNEFRAKAQLAFNITVQPRVYVVEKNKTTEKRNRSSNAHKIICKLCNISIPNGKKSQSRHLWATHMSEAQVRLNFVARFEFTHKTTLE